MTITIHDQDVYVREYRMLEILVGTSGTRVARPTVNLGDGLFKTIYDVGGIYGIDRLTLVTRTVDGQTLLDSARLYNDGIRLAAFSGFAVPLADIEARGLAALYSGDDLITGNTWKNALRGYDGDDTVRGGWGDDRLTGNAGKDWLNGMAGDDVLYGGLNGDLLLGGNGNDALFGGASVDRLSGGTGDDTMTGGDHRDTFVFWLGDGSDTITDFDAGLDKIEIKSGADSFNQLRITDSGDDVLIAFGDVQIRLQNVYFPYVGPEDFIFT